ncbi:TetR/AcrR family transcriptional regulator [Mycolicibacter arupensis]|uniref:TetR/AcrR family transcriptional regulator n=1 Tax=Mycolicibacter arupensis TaxID=342002 RepID=UPI00122C5419|nr:TetR/AcrR family transcriptional regulator [Mycolicibacter arupensis]KAA1430328.1 TetR/AcrR family transcriptional regulator [Mycolicibacter arupensis]
METPAPTAPGGRRIRGLDADQRRAQRREQLLAAAFELFAREGYVSTSIEQICQTAYVGNKAFYEVFDSKEDCYLALMKELGSRVATKVIEELRHVVPGEGDEATVRRVLTVLAHELVVDPRLVVVVFQECAGISSRVEARRRADRRWAAATLEAFWSRRAQPGENVDYRAVAIATVGGLFEIIADFLDGADPPCSVDDLTHDLTSFVLTVGRGIHAPARSA